MVYFAADTGTNLESGGVIRSCARITGLDATCKHYNNEPVPEWQDQSRSATLFTGEVCYCTGDLCNSAPAAVIGHLTVSLIGVVSLLALTTARLLSQ